MILVDLIFKVHRRFVAERAGALGCILTLFLLWEANRYLTGRK
jgi:hypothetical protein